MVYTPRISKEESELLRRLAWGVETYMTTTLKQVLQIMPRLVDCKEICEKCKDKSICKTCAFNRDQEHDQIHLTLLIDFKKDHSLTGKEAGNRKRNDIIEQNYIVRPLFSGLPFTRFF